MSGIELAWGREERGERKSIRGGACVLNLYVCSIRATVTSGLELLRLYKIPM